MAARALDVWLYGRAGRLTAEEGVLAFRYDPNWVEDRMPPLSQSLPVRAEPYVGDAVHSFFSNLLPEGEVRQHVAWRFGVSVGNDFELLAAIGGDCAGAVSVTPPDQPPEPEEGPLVSWFSDEELADVVAELPTRPMLADPDGGIRLSLAGAQDKLPVVLGDGRVGVPLRGTPSTHILKTPIARFDDTVVNEAFCLTVASEIGLDAATASVMRVGHDDVLLVERYDREREGDAVRRVHQEDFCQALGVPPEHKYQREGGPSMADCVGLMRRASARPGRDILNFADAVIANYLIGNHDAHAKNYSLLYRPDGATMAPLYDLVCTTAYPSLSRKMAMKLGGEYRPDWIRSRHVERFAEEADLGTAALRGRVRRLAAAAPDVAENVLTDFREKGLHRPVLDRVFEVVVRRAAHLESELRGRQANVATAE